MPNQSPPRVNRTFLDGTLSDPFDNLSNSHQPSSLRQMQLKGYGTCDSYVDGLASSPSNMTPRGGRGVTQGSTDATGAVSTALKRIRQLRLQRSHQQVTAAMGQAVDDDLAAAPSGFVGTEFTPQRLASRSQFGSVIKTTAHTTNKYLLSDDGTNLPEGEHTTFLTDSDEDEDEQRALAAAQANRGVFSKSLADVQREDDERRLPASVLCEEGLTPEITNPDPTRVVPQFINALTSFSAARQRLHVKSFAENLATFLAYDDTTPSEWEMLLVVLFVLARRRGGLSVLQRRYHGDISNRCLGILCQLLSSPEDNPRFPEVLTALNTVMYKVGCTKEDDLLDAFFERPDAVAGLPADALRLQDVSATLANWATDDDVDSSDEDLPEVESRVVSSHGLRRGGDPSSVAAAIDTLPAASEVAETSVVAETASRPRPWEWLSFRACVPPADHVPPPTLAHPLHYSLDMLSPEERGGLTEEDFLTLEHWFRQLPDWRPSNSHLGTNAVTRTGSSPFTNDIMATTPGSRSRSPLAFSGDPHSARSNALGGSVTDVATYANISLIDHLKIVAPAVKQISTEAGRSFVHTLGESVSISRVSAGVGSGASRNWLGVVGDVVLAAISTEHTATPPDHDEVLTSAASCSTNGTKVFHGSVARSRPNVVGGGFLGSRFVTDRIARTFATTFNPTGACTFFQLLQFFFPQCPEKTLLKRCQGVPLEDELVSLADLVIPNGKVDAFLQREKERHLMLIPDMTLDRAREIIKSGAPLPPAPVSSAARATTDALLSESLRHIGDGFLEANTSPPKNTGTSTPLRRKSVTSASDPGKRKTSSAGKRPPRSPSVTPGSSVLPPPVALSPSTTPMLQPFHLDEDSLTLLRHMLEDQRATLVGAPPTRDATPDHIYVEPFSHEVHRRLRLLQRTDWGSGGLEAELGFVKNQTQNQSPEKDNDEEALVTLSPEDADDPLRRELAVALKAEKEAQRKAACHNPMLLQPVTLTPCLARELYRWFCSVDWCGEGVILVSQLLAISERNQSATMNRIGSVSSHPTSALLSSQSSPRSPRAIHGGEDISLRVQRSRNVASSASNMDGPGEVTGRSLFQISSRGGPPPVGFFIGDWRLEIEALLQYKQGTVSHNWRQLQEVATSTSPLDRNRGESNKSPSRAGERIDRQRTHPGDFPPTVAFSFEEIIDYLFTDHSPPTVDRFVEGSNATPLSTATPPAPGVTEGDDVHYPVHLASQSPDDVFKQPFRRLPKEEVRAILKAVKLEVAAECANRQVVTDSLNSAYRDKLRSHLSSAEGPTTTISPPATPVPAQTPSRTATPAKGRTLSVPRRSSVSGAAAKRTSTLVAPPPPPPPPMPPAEPTREDVQRGILEHLNYPPETWPLILGFVEYNPAGDMSLSIYGPPAPYGSEVSSHGGRLGGDGAEASPSPFSADPPDGNSMIRQAPFFGTLDAYMSTSVMEWANAVVESIATSDLQGFDLIKDALSSLPITTPLHPHYLMHLQHALLKRAALKQSAARRRAMVKAYRLGCRREAAALAIRKQLAHNMKAEQEHIQLSFGPAPQEKCVSLFGFNLTPAVFDISVTFLRKPERRPQLQRLLTVLDLSGIPVRWFVHNSALLQRVLPSNRPQSLLFTSPVHCYRDFAMCTKRPSLSAVLRSRGVPLSFTEFDSAQASGVDYSNATGEAHRIQFHEVPLLL